MSRGGKITLREMKIRTSEILYTFDISGMAKNFVRDNCLSLKYNVDILQKEDELPSIFFLALAPVCWILDAEYYSIFRVTDIAKDCIINVGGYLSNHYKWRKTNPLKNINVLTFSSKLKKSTKDALFFSGGIDSLSAFYRYKHRIGTLIQLTNFDYLNENLVDDQLEGSINFVKAYAKEHHLNYVHVETNLADLIKHSLLDKFFPKNCSFWYGLQHVNHIAVAAALIGSPFKNLILAGSNNLLHKKVNSCASKSIFVNLYKHDWHLVLVEENVLRQRKIEFLQDLNPACFKDIRVCYSSGNPLCSSCNKCIGTALMIAASGYQIINSGFPLSILTNMKRIIELVQKNHISFELLEQALKGRILYGSRTQRMSQLYNLVLQTLESTQMK